MIFYTSLIICIVGGIQGIFLAFVLKRLAKQRSESYNWLITLLVLVSTTLISRTLFLYENSVDIRLTLFSDLVLFLYGPLFFFFTKESLESKLEKALWPHFVPASIHILSVLPQLLISVHSYLEFTTTTGWFVYIMVLVGLALVHNAYYWFQSWRVLNRCARELGAKAVELRSSYLGLSVKLFGAILILFSIAFVLMPFVYVIAINIYQLTWIIASLLTFAITYHLIMYPLRFGSYFIKSRQRVHKNLQEQESLQNLASKLKFALEKDNIYLEPNISLRTLSEKLETNQVLLSKAINQEFNCSFYNLINHYRTKQFIKLAESNDHSHLNYFGLAIEAGFNSKTTFNKYFKMYKGVTPSEYFKKNKAS